MIRGADLSHADICEISTELEAEENLDPPPPPATFITTGAADCGGSCPRPIDTRRRLSRHISGIGLAGTWVPNSAVAPVRPGCSGRRNCKCESGRTARGSSRPRLRAPASGGHPSQSSTGRDNCCGSWQGWGGRRERLGQRGFRNAGGWHVEVRVVGCDGGPEGSAGHRVEESSAVVPEWGPRL
jgi:hypothetical protein